MDQSRRAFLGLNFKPSRLPVAKADAGVCRPGERLSIPVIAPERCNGCGACVSVCPRDAITLVRDVDGPAYVSRAGSCSECDACMTVCDREAIRIEPSARETSVRLLLYEYTCLRCSAPFHWPAVRGTGQTLCRICAACATRPGRIAR